MRRPGSPSHQRKPATDGPGAQPTMHSHARPPEARSHEGLHVVRGIRFVVRSFRKCTTFSIRMPFEQRCGGGGHGQARGSRDSVEGRGQGPRSDCPQADERRCPSTPPPAAR
eukprot:7146255-Prymnesium_polylepis.1